RRPVSSSEPHVSVRENADYREFERPPGARGSRRPSTMLTIWSLAPRPRLVNKVDGTGALRSSSALAAAPLPGRATGCLPDMSANLEQLLLARSDWFAREIMKGVRASEHAYITPAQSRLLAHMGGKPMSMAELARRLAISRQAVHRTVGELARRGILELLDDPQRRSSKRVAYSERGRTVNRPGARIIAAIEQRLAQKRGARSVETLRELLEAGWD